MANSWKNPCSTTDLIRYAQMARVTDKVFFSKIQPITQTTVTNLQHNFCSVMYFIPTDKMNAAIRIRRIIKVKICKCEFDRLRHITATDQTC